MLTNRIFTGVYPFLATPFTNDGEAVDAARLESHVDELIRDGKVHGVTALGSTGEFALMSESERQLVAEVADRPATAALRHDAGVAMQSGNVLLVADRRERLSLLAAGTGKQALGLVARAGEDDMVIDVPPT